MLTLPQGYVLMPSFNANTILEQCLGVCLIVPHIQQSSSRWQNKEFIKHKTHVLAHSRISFSPHGGSTSLWIFGLIIRSSLGPVNVEDANMLFKSRMSAEGSTISSCKVS